MTIIIQNQLVAPLPISEKQIKKWMKLTLDFMSACGNIGVCIVDENEMKELNHQYRGKDKSTNVLSFPSELPEMLQKEMNMLGDIIICPDVLANEAIDLNKPLLDHWAHITVHGVLHLLGYDHIEEADAEIMQGYETQILKSINIPNPYSEQEGATIEH